MSWPAGMGLPVPLWRDARYGLRAMRVGEASNPGPIDSQYDQCADTRSGTAQDMELPAPVSCPGCGGVVALTRRPRRCLHCGPHKSTSFCCSACIAAGVPAYYCRQCCEDACRQARVASTAQVDPIQEAAGAASTSTSGKLARAQDESLVVRERAAPAEISPVRRSDDDTDGMATTAPTSSSACPSCREALVKMRAAVADRDMPCAGEGCSYVFRMKSGQFRSWVYHCQHCKCRYCPDCNARLGGKVAQKSRVNATRAATSVLSSRKANAQVGAVESNGPVPLDSLGDMAERQPGEWDGIELELSRLPPVLTRATLQWIPRGLERRNAAIRLRVLANAMDAETQRVAPRTRRVWSRLAVCIPFALLWDPRPLAPLIASDIDHASGAAVDSRPDAPDPGLRRVLRRRFEFAERGNFAQLLREAGAAELDAAQTMRDQPRRINRSDADSAVALERAAIAADRGQLRTAARLLRGSRLLPPTTATAAAIMDMYQTGQEAIERNAHGIDPPGPRVAGADIKPQHIREHIRNARAYAHAGPSGERNSHIAALLSCPRGQPVLLRWARMWSQPGLSDEFRNPWLQAIVVGGDKGGGKARPITFEETLLKLASSAAVRCQLPMVRRAAGHRQFGVYHSGGAPQVAWEVKCHMAAQPDMVYVALDIRNGFGAARRVDALHTADQHCPGISGLFRNLWSAGAQPAVWMQTENGWEQAAIHDGLLQGACEAPVAFAFALRTALEDFEQRRLGSPSLACIRYRIWAYVDDMTVQVQAEHAGALLHLLREVLSEHGLDLRADKCTAHCPLGTNDQKADEDARMAVEGFAHYTSDGLHLLGTVAEGEFEVLVGEGAGEQAGPSPISKRLAAALDLCGKIRSMVTSHTSCRRLAPAWKLLAIVCNNALSYDCCVSSPGALAPHAQSLDRTVAGILPVFLGDQEVQTLTVERCRLPRAAGGCDLPSAAHRSQTSFLSQYLAIVPNICRDLARDGLSLGDARAALHKAGLLPAAQDCVAALEQRGVHLDTEGLPSLMPSGQPVDIEAMTTAHQPTLRHRQRLWRMPLAQASISKINDSAIRKDLLDLGGEENGLWINANPGPDVTPLDDLEFRVNLRLRLGLRVMQPGLCQHRRKPTSTCRFGKRCLEACDPYGSHAVECMIGGARTVLHNIGCDLIYTACRDAGFGAQTEVIVPCLATDKMTEPRIDVEAWGHPGFPHLRIDFTVASNAARRYQQAVATPAHAAETAERGKTHKYGTTAPGGVNVTGAALELRGRHGPGLDWILRTCAGLARSRSSQRGSEPRRLLQSWRIRLSIALARFCYVAISNAADSLAVVDARAATLVSVQPPGPEP